MCPSCGKYLRLKDMCSVMAESQVVVVDNNANKVLILVEF